jgi:hypothetical protein
MQQQPIGLTVVRVTGNQAIPDLLHMSSCCRLVLDLIAAIDHTLDDPIALKSGLDSLSDRRVPREYQKLAPFR